MFFEAWSADESGVDAKLFFGMLMTATTATPPRIILRRDKQLDPSSESGDIPDSESFVCVGVFIAICSVALGSEVECLQIFLEETKSDIYAFLSWVPSQLKNAVNKTRTTSLAAYAT
jgi:hypothetical protein